jgi:hypothetical protein
MNSLQAIADNLIYSLNRYMNQRQQKREAKLEGQCRILAEIVAAIKPVYSKADPNQKAFIETMVGAAIWYIPKPSSAWTGRVSIGALKAFHPDSGHPKPKFSEEHVYPRKVAARLLLENKSIDGSDLSTLFKEKYGRLHLITPDENKSVQPHQRANVFTTPYAAYSKAGIVLIEVANHELSLVKRRDRKTIERYLK